MNAAADPVRDLLDFIDASPTPWHAVAETVRRLEAAGFRGLEESEPFALGAGDKVYVVRGGSTVIAFEIGTEPPSQAGFRMVGAHTDSPNLR
ncbi:MAG: M18 family aminopeptidase, partial [Myxococcales bacterium]|nr:M18 family aminopeptidase [Myxococcales bacterium]